MTDDVIARAKTACDRWSRTPGVTIEVWEGLVDAEDDYRNAPQLVADLISLAESQAAEIQRLHSWDGLMSILDGHYRESEAIAEQVRRSWTLPDGPVGDVIELLERHGVVVIRLPLGSADVDAFSLPLRRRSGSGQSRGRTAKSSTRQQSPGNREAQRPAHARTRR